MLRKLGIAIAYFVAIVYVLSLLLPAYYCLTHGCQGPGELDAFMPAFMLGPAGAVATSFALRNALQNIRKKQSWSAALWPLAVIFAIVLLATIAFIGWMIYETLSHR